jgi:polar amino acid transport system substrate-binding protein
MTSRTRRSVLSVVVVAVLALAGCAPAATDAAPPRDAPQEQAAARPAAVEPAECEGLTSSYEPARDALKGEGPTLDEIRERGVLRVGVSADTLLMGSRDPISGQIEGFDIDMLHQIADALLGNPDALQFRVITSGQRIELLENHEVDLVARAFSITCERWEQVAFSAEYFHAGQKVLVTRDSEATGIDDLAGQRVCAPDETTTLERLADYPDIEAVPAPTHTQCLVLFQQGKVDAITGDDTILAGFAAQDPYAKVVGEAISDEPYGIGVAADQVDLVRFVNAVLDEVKADGRWKASYGRWLGALGKAPRPPESVYGRTP